MKKGTGLIFVFMVLVLFSTELTSAYYLPSVRGVVENVVQGFIDIFEPILQAILGGNDWASSFLFERLLLFVILFSITYVILGKVPIFEDNHTVKVTVAIIVPLIGVRFMEEGWLMTVIIQYEVLAIALTAILPFVIYFFFLQNVGKESAVIRKIGWIFFIIVYLGLWATVENSGTSAIYFWTMVVSLFFLLFDGTIHRYYVNQEIKSSGSANKWEHIAKLRRDIDETNSDIRRGNIPDRIGRNIIKKKQRQVNWLLKH